MASIVREARFADPADAETCRFVWATDVLPDELGPRVAELMDVGLKAMTATLEG